MEYEAWPSPDSRRGPLPRIEDLPISEQGYDQESVRRAFDDFYRHAAQLDASLKALEAVAAFQRDAAELRNDLRSLRALGFGGGEPSWASSWTVERPRPELSATALRLAGEAGVLVAVAVVAGVAHLQAWVIVALMAAALGVVWLSEWLAARARTRVPASVWEPYAYQELPAADESSEPAPYVETPALEAQVGWSAFEPPPEEVEEVEVVEALTAIEQPQEATEEDAAPSEEAEEEEAEEAEADEDEADEDDAEEDEGDEEPEEPEESAAESEPEARPSRRWLRRRRPAEEQAEAEELTPGPRSHVRVLPAPVDEDPWERGFDGEPDQDALEAAERSGLGRVERDDL